MLTPGAHRAEPANVSGFGNLARRPSGIIVPAELAGTPERGVPVTGKDLDGRRRIVWTQDERRDFDKVVKLLRGKGMGYVLGCVGDIRFPAGHPRAGQVAFQDGTPACGLVMQMEGQGTADPGFGCKCTRIHFEAPKARPGRWGGR